MRFTNRFRIVQLNAENLFLLMDLYQGQDLSELKEKEWQKLSTANVPNKPLHKTRQLAKALLEIDAEIVMLNEVGGLESVENFNRYFLQDRYDTHLIEGNSTRGIDVGYLTRKGLSLKFLLTSHRNRPLNFLYPHEVGEQNLKLKSHFFSRDVAELRAFRPGENAPLFIILLTHLKSKLDPDGIDPGGRDRRSAELKTLLSIYRDVKNETEGKIPILVAGDFNGWAQRGRFDPEFAPLMETDLIDVFDVTEKPSLERNSQVQILRQGGSENVQIDYILLSKHLHPFLQPEGCFVYVYRNELGLPVLPKNMDERDHLPSDHFPVVVTFHNWPPDL